MSKTSIDFAKEYLGVKEDNGSNDDKNGRIRELVKTSGWKGAPRIAYCAASVSAWKIMSGEPIGGMLDNGSKLSPGTVSCYAMQKWFALDPDNVGAIFLKPGTIPMPLDVIFYDTNNPGTFNHVGIVEEVSGSKIYTIEANTSNEGIDFLKGSGNASAAQTNNDPSGGGIHRRCRSVAGKSISGYGRVDKEMIMKSKIPLMAPQPSKVTPDEVVAILVQSSDEQIKGVQIILQQLGLYSGTIDGLAGPLTRKGMKSLAEKAL